MRGDGSRHGAKQVSVVFTNIRSVIRHRDNLCSVIDSCCADIVILTETWLSSRVKNSEIFCCESASTFIVVIGVIELEEVY